MFPILYQQHMLGFVEKMFTFEMVSSVSIACGGLVEESQIRVDQQALAPFYARLIALALEKKTNAPAQRP